MTPHYWRIAIPVPLRRLFDYLPPYDDAQPPQRGARVRVTFGKRDVIGVFWDVVDKTDVPLNKLQAVRAVLERESLLSPSLLQLAEFSAQYYLHPLGDVLALSFPTLLRSVDAPKPDRLPAFRLVSDIADEKVTPLQRAPRQRALLQFMQARGGSALKAELLDAGFVDAQWRALIKLGALEKCELDVDKTPSAVKPRPSELALNDAQQAAVTAISQTPAFAAFLLHGVTGSGKTEVYLRAIEAVLAREQQALILVPEIGLTPQTEARFKARFGDHIAVVHSALTDRQRWLAWEAARQRQVRVIIGTRSALFVPFANLGLIIVDEEHDVSFKQQDGFRYHARDLAVYRAQLEKVPVVLGSATPSLESLRNVAQKRYTALTLPQRAGDAQLPTMRCIDLRQQTLDEGISPPLLQAMRKHLQAQGQVLLFLNRRGFAPTLMCHACGYVAQCKRCDARYTLHKKINRLRCHHCTSEAPVPTQCPQCQANNWLSLGQGTERIEAALARHFPEQAIARIDRDTSRGRDAMAQWHTAIRAGRYQILLGTQMLAKGHDFPDVTLSALLDVDSALFATDFRAPERLAQLVTQVAGRAGRGLKAGEVLLQTHQPEHPLMQALLGGGYDPWSQAALTDRDAHGLPPYQSHVLLRAEAGKADAAQALLRRFKQALANDARLSVFGPIPAPMPLRAGRFRFQLLFESSERRLAPQLLAPLLREAESWPEARAARWSVDVDPVDMM